MFRSSNLISEEFIRHFSTNELSGIGPLTQFFMSLPLEADVILF